MEEITAIKSFQDFTKDSAPSVCNCVANAPTSMPALPNSARTSSQFPPSTGSNSPNSVCSQRLQCCLGHRVYRERGSQGLNIKDVGSFRVFASGARPQQTLGTPSAVVYTLPTCRGKHSTGCLVGALSDCDAKLVTKFLRDLVGNGDIPATDKDRCHGANPGIEAGIDPPLNTTQLRVGRFAGFYLACPLEWHDFPSLRSINAVLGTLMEP